MSTARLAWHAGSFAANNGSIGIEHEGKKGQPLTSAQYQATLRLHKWIFDTHGFGSPSRQTTLREHREFDNTDCPGGRIPWVRLIKDLQEDEKMTPEQMQEIHTLVAGLATQIQEVKNHLAASDGARDSHVSQEASRVIANQVSGGGASAEEVVNEIARRLGK